MSTAKHQHALDPTPRALTDSERARRSMDRRLSSGCVSLKLIVPREVRDRLKAVAQRHGETQAQAIARLVGAQS